MITIPGFLVKPLIAAGFAIAIGVGSFAGGSLWQGKRMAEKQAIELKRQQDEFQERLAEEMIRSQHANQTLTYELEAVAAKQEKSNKTVIASLNKQLENYKESPYAASCPDPGSYRLSVDTLSLFNAAIEGTVSSVYSASGSDEEGTRASEVGIVKLTEHDLKVIQSYKELAKRHNALVDYIEAWQKQRVEEQ